MLAGALCIPVNLFKRDDSPDHIPRKVQESIESIGSAIESVKANATEADLSISFEGMSLRSAIEGSSRLIDVPRCLEKDSMTRINRIAHTWNGLADMFEIVGRARARLQEATVQDSGPAELAVRIRAEAEKLERVVNERLAIHLRQLKKELGRP